MKKTFLLLTVAALFAYPVQAQYSGGGGVRAESDPIAMASISNMIPAYGEIYIHDGTNTLNLTATTNYFRVANFTSGISSNVTCTSSALVVQVAGTYRVAGQLSMFGQNDKTYETAIFVNGAHQNTGEAKITTASTAVSMSCSFGAVLNLAVGDTISMRINGSGTGNITPLQASLSIVRISPSATTYIAGAQLEQTVTTNTATVPSSAAVQVAISNAVPVGVMLKSGNPTNIIIGLTNSVDYVKMTYTGGILTFTEAYNGVTNTYNSLNN